MDWLPLIGDWPTAAQLLLVGPVAAFLGWWLLGALWLCWQIASGLLFPERGYVPTGFDD